MNAFYIHLPFCEKKCFYCSFVVSIGQEQRIEQYLHCLEKELAKYKGETIDSLYVGGGTPTFLTHNQLQKFLSFIDENFFFSHDSEFSIEANPEHLDDVKLKMLKNFGINRISLGIQSLNNTYLHYLGRNHNAQTAIEAVRRIKDCGFKNVNLDLMYSFPGQTTEEIEEDVKKAAQLESQHISIYTLTVEPHSRFYVRDVHETKGEIQAQQYELVVRLLADYGFQQYEISNFSKKGKESRHNLNYWQGGNYIGVGVGAHSHENGRRSWNVSTLMTYIKRIEINQSPQDEAETLSREQQFIETLLIGLRMSQGIHLKSLKDRFQCSFNRGQQNRIDHFLDEGLLTLKEGQLRTSSSGRLVLDTLSSQLIN